LVRRTSRKHLRLTAATGGRSQPHDRGGPRSGLFGYGAIGLGAITENIGQPPSGSRYTAYFSTTIDLGPNAANTVTDLTADVLADDGAFVYINGQLAGGLNVGGISDTYLALTGPVGNEGALTTITLDKSLLIDGVNSISVSVHNTGNTSSDLGFQMEIVAAVPTNIAPTITGAVASQSVDDDSTNQPFSAVTIGDDDGDSLDLSVTLDVAANGTLSGGGFTETGVGTGVYTVSAADPTAATTAIQALTFTPTANQVDPTLTATTTFTVSADDSAAVVTDATTTVIATSINDAPVTIGDTPSATEDGAAVTTGVRACF
jgi:hypothetical protein